MLIIQGLHYGKHTFNNLDSHSHFYVELQPYNWKVQRSKFPKSIKRNIYKEHWLKVGCLAVVEDPHQKSTVFVSNILKGNQVTTLCHNLTKRNIKLSRMLRVRCPYASHTTRMDNIIRPMLHFAKTHQVPKGIRKVVCIHESKGLKFIFE